MNDDPYHDRKPYHMFHLVSSKGDVSPLCAERPRKINLKRELWTFDKGAVTCKKCLAKLASSSVASSPWSAPSPPCATAGATRSTTSRSAARRSTPRHLGANAC